MVFLWAVSFIATHQLVAAKVTPELDGFWKSLSHVFRRVNSTVLLESHVIHRRLGYAGTVDCVAR